MNCTSRRRSTAEEEVVEEAEVVGRQDHGPALGHVLDADRPRTGRARQDRRRQHDARQRGRSSRAGLRRARARGTSSKNSARARVDVDLWLHRCRLLPRARTGCGYTLLPAHSRRSTALPPLVAAATRRSSSRHRGARSGPPPATASRPASSVQTPGRDAGQVGGAERGGLGDLRHHHRARRARRPGTASARVGDRAAVGAQLVEPLARGAPPSPRRRRRSGRRSPRAPRAPGARASVPRVRPTIVPRAYGSQCGEPRPVSAGTK